MHAREEERDEKIENERRWRKSWLVGEDKGEKWSRGGQKGI
jgi:hypothetical protein